MGHNSTCSNFCSRIFVINNNINTEISFYESKMSFVANAVGRKCACSTKYDR